MSAHRSRLRALALAALGTFACVAGPALAAQFTLSNTRIHLDAAHTTETIVIANKEARLVSFEVHVKKWTQTADGKWTQVPTQDLVVHPLIVRVDPNGEARLRIGTLSPNVSAEQAYRFELKELPDGVKAKAGEVRMLTTVSVPVFVQPKGAKADPVMTIDAISTKAIDFNLRNNGTAYAPPGDGAMRVLDANGRKLYDATLEIGYVLAGARLPVHAGLPASVCAHAAKVELKFGDAAPLVASVAQGQRKCAP